MADMAPDVETSADSYGDESNMAAEKMDRPHRRKSRRKGKRGHRKSRRK